MLQELQQEATLTERLIHQSVKSLIDVVSGREPVFTKPEQVHAFINTHIPMTMKHSVNLPDNPSDILYIYKCGDSQRTKQQTKLTFNSKEVKIQQISLIFSMQNVQNHSLAICMHSCVLCLLSPVLVKRQSLSV